MLRGCSEGGRDKTRVIIAMDISGKLDVRNMQLKLGNLGATPNQMSALDVSFSGANNAKIFDDNITPLNLFQSRTSPFDSGYSSLPPSPLISTEIKLRRRSLSLQDTEVKYSELQFCKRKLFNDDKKDKSPSNELHDSKRPNPTLKVSYRRPASIDILNVLRPFPHIISKIFKYLNGENLSAVCCVSKIWNQLCKKDKRANEKRRKFLFLANLNKENPLSRYQSPSLPRPKESTPLNNETTSNNLLRPFLIVEDRTPRTNFERCVQAAKNLPSGGTMLKCIRCSSPSSVFPSTPVASCVSPACGFQFCVKCRCQFTHGHSCRSYTLSTPAGSNRNAGGGGGCSSNKTGRIGSAESLKHLRRCAR